MWTAIGQAFSMVFDPYTLMVMVLSCAPRAEVPVAAQPPVAVAQATTVAELPAVVTRSAEAWSVTSTRSGS